MIQFYSPDVRKTNMLDSSESQHCVKVLRKKEGEKIYVTDGEGTRFECLIVKGDTKGVKVSVLSEEKITKNWIGTLSLIVAPTKNADRMAWLVEKCTEIGIDRIIFVKCDRSERKTVNTDRLIRNAASAMNQSLKTIMPVLEVLDFKDILTLNGYKYFGYCSPEVERFKFVDAYKNVIKQFITEGKKTDTVSTQGPDVVIAIGPEGDFSQDEVCSLLKSGYRAVTFGDERLRTETAAMYSVAAFHITNDLFF